MVMPTYYSRGIPIMHPSITTRRPMADMATPTPSEASASVIRSHDLRALGLAAATRRLSASVADLDIVYTARARSDLRWCPVCPRPHPVE